MDKVSKNIVIGFTIALVLILSSGGFVYYQMTKQFEATNANLDTLKVSMEASDKALDKKISDVDKSLASQTSSLNTKISGLKEDTDKSTKTLSDLIKEVERQSNIELERVKRDIDTVSVSAGDFSNIIQKVLPSVVSVLTDKGQGSGAFISDDGYVVTNYHVIQNANKLRIYTYDKETFDANLIGTDISLDIAVLKINATYTPLEFDDSNEVKVGEKVIALGNPGGLDFTVTEGIVSATGRKISSNGIGYLQIDVALNPGNSGGPLVNSRGKIIGINNLKLGGDFEALGFAIPSNVVNDIVDNII